jgi:hypothetical protein
MIVGMLQLCWYNLQIIVGILQYLISCVSQGWCHSKTMQAFLRRYLLEKIDPEVMSGKPSATEPVERTFATVASIHRPPSSKRTLNMTPLEVISKPKNPTSSNDRPPYSPLKIYFFEGCHRKSPGIYRKMLTDLGFNARLVRDITFLSDDIMQVTTYESVIEELSNILLGISTSVRCLDNLNPIKGDNYSKYGTFSDEEVKAGYFAMMTKSAERLTKAAESVKALKRSANFLNKINKGILLILRKIKSHICEGFLQIN